MLRPRSGRTGHFWGCSTFPACTYTCNTLPGAGRDRRHRGRHPSATFLKEGSNRDRADSPEPGRPRDAPAVRRSVP
ncbi:topoisomerase DNA-binding C4 zinc finger domain-containing protein [Ornithinimicrobium flavum]|uniref:topoisomerase DNA-binding C4 zinc finger domain-containing protein n=1 Tax=Ornithinimicrobium flavum TaxID=1288636 RepID=UPI0010701837